MASTIRCDIVSAEAEIFHGEATMVVATGEMGELGIAPRHAPLITRLRPGKVVVTTPDGEQLDFAISGGILEVQPQVVSVLADTAIRSTDIDEASVLKAKEEAERVLANRGESMRRYNAWRLRPSSDAAWAIVPPARASACSIASRSGSDSGCGAGGTLLAGAGAKPRSAGVMVSFADSSSARWMMFFSSRTLPGQ